VPNDQTPVPAPDKPRAKEEPGPNHYRYYGTGSANHTQGKPYDKDNQQLIMADFIEILANGYTVDRANRLMNHWATSPEWHINIRGERIEEPHPSYGRACPSRKTLYIWRDRPEPEYVEFKAMWDEAINVRGLEALEDHATDLAFAGNDKLIMFLLKARNPQKYANFGALGGSSFNITITPGDEAL